MIASGSGSNSKTVVPPGSWPSPRGCLSLRQVEGHQPARFGPLGTYAQKVCAHKIDLADHCRFRAGAKWLPQPAARLRKRDGQ